MQLSPVFYLSVELKSRDLDSRLLIAAHCLAKGFCVVVGNQWGIWNNIETAPRGQHLFKSMNAIQAQYLRQCRDAGHLVTSTDEEALARNAAFLPDYVDADGLDACHQFYAQSELHRRALIAKFPSKDPNAIRVTGNSRLDFVSFRGRQKLAGVAAKLRDEFGPFILINTNFTQTNSLLGETEDVVEAAAQGRSLNLDDSAEAKSFREYVAAEKDVKSQVVSLIRWLGVNVPTFRVVLRPHPAERLEFWKSELAEVQNVRISTEGSPAPWLMAASLVVHTNCTTGLEAALLDRPVINLFPARDKPWAGRFVMPALNATFDAWSEVANAIQAETNSGGGAFERFKAPASAFQDFYPDYRKGRASKQIAEEMINLFKSHGVTSQTPNGFLAGGSRWLVAERVPIKLRKVYFEAPELAQRFDQMTELAELKRKVKVAQIAESMFLFLPA
jgi:surface carbohydrate biosynthesis protein